MAGESPDYLLGSVDVEVLQGFPQVPEPIPHLHKEAAIVNFLHVEINRLVHRRKTLARFCLHRADGRKFAVATEVAGYEVEHRHLVLFKQRPVHQSQRLRAARFQERRHKFLAVAHCCAFTSYGCVCWVTNAWNDSAHQGVVFLSGTSDR